MERTNYRISSFISTLRTAENLTKHMISATISQYGSEVQPALFTGNLPGNLDEHVRYLSLHCERNVDWDATIASYVAKHEYGDPRWIVNRRVTCRSVIP